MPRGPVTVMVQLPDAAEANTSTTALLAPRPIDCRVSPYASARRCTTVSRGAHCADCAAAGPVARQARAAVMLRLLEIIVTPFPLIDPCRRGKGWRTRREDLVNEG